jgi:hypothetical protein
MAGDFTRILADCLDAIEQRGSTFDECLVGHPDHSAALAELLPIASALRSAPAVAPSPEFRANARRRLAARLSARSAPITPRRSLVPALVLRRPALITALVVAVLVMLSSGIVAASAASLPNDLLYSVKIAVEELRLSLSPDSLNRSNLHLAFAAQRLDEIARLIRVDRGSDALIALDNFTAHIRAAASIANAVPDATDRNALVEHVNASIDQSDVTLTQVAPQLPSSVQPAIRRAQETLRSARQSEERHESPAVPPTSTPTMIPTIAPTRIPGAIPTPTPTPAKPVVGSPPTGTPPQWPTAVPTPWLTHAPPHWPTYHPTIVATFRPPHFPTAWPTIRVTLRPTHFPTAWPTPNVTHWPTHTGTLAPPPHPTATPRSNATPWSTPIIFPTWIPPVWPTIGFPRVSRP